MMISVMAVPADWLVGCVRELSRRPLDRASNFGDDDPK